MLQSIKSASVEPGSLFTIADYGCADGGTSMPLMYACVKELRKIHGDGLPIHVIYEDQPVNDFKAVFLRLQGKCFIDTQLLHCLIVFFWQKALYFLFWLISMKPDVTATNIAMPT